MWVASKCNLCGDCLVKCLYVDYDKDKAVAEIKALMEGKEAEILSKCITCCACREYCPTGADPHDLILKAQEKFDAFPVTLKGADRMDLAFEAPNEVIFGDPDKPILSLCVMEGQIPEGALDGNSQRHGHASGQGVVEESQGIAGFKGQGQDLSLAGPQVRYERNRRETARHAYLDPFDARQIREIQPFGDPRRNLLDDGRRYDQASGQRPQERKQIKLMKVLQRRCIGEDFTQCVPPTSAPPR